MKKRGYIAGSLIISLLSVCILLSASYSAILVTNQSATYSAPTAVITFRLNTYGIVTVYIKEAANHQVIKTIPVGPRTAGWSSVVWNGTKDSGVGSATTGTYYAVVYACGTAIADYTPLLSTPITFTGGAGVAFNKNISDRAYFGRLYATDLTDDVIKMFYPDGTFIRSTSGGVTWGASAPYGIDIDTTSIVWINDRSNARTEIFDPELNYLFRITGGSNTRMDICVTGDTTNGALYLIRGAATESQVNKSKIINGVPEGFQYIYDPGHANLRGVLATQDNSTVYVANAYAPAPNGLIQLTGSDYSYSQTAWTTSVDSAFALDFSPDGQYLWVATMDTVANVKKVRISDGAVVSSFQAGTGAAGCIAVDPAGNIAVFYGGNEYGRTALNIWQPPDNGSSWQAITNPFNFTAVANFAPSVDSSSADPASIPADGSTQSLLTVYISDPDGYSDVTAVRINLSSLGGSSTQSMTFVSGSGTNAVYQVTVTAAVGSRAGNHVLQVSVYDTGGNVALGEVNLYVTAGVITGKVTVSGSTVGIPGATVTATGGTGPYTAISGSDGTYIMDVGVGTYMVTASKSGWNPGAGQSGISVVLGSTVENVNVSLNPKTVAEAKTLSLPATVAVGGVIIAPRGASPAPPWGLSGQYYIADEGSPNGLRILDTQAGRFPQMGEKVVVEGTMPLPSTEYPELMMRNPTFYAVYGFGQVPAPVTITCADVNSTNYGKLVRLENVTVISTTLSTITSCYTIQDSSGTALVFYDTNSTVSEPMMPMPSVGTTLSAITGVVAFRWPWVTTDMVVVKPWYIVQVIVNPAQVQLTPGQSIAFTASGGTPPYTWSVSDPAIGSIDSTTGYFTALANGSCIVTATDANGYRGYALVIVQATEAPIVSEPENLYIYQRDYIDF